MQVFSRPGCHLCEVLVEQLLPIIRGRLDLEICNIDDNVDWQTRYGLRIPVLTFDGREICHFTLDRDAVVGIAEKRRQANSSS